MSAAKRSPSKLDRQFWLPGTTDDEPDAPAEVPPPESPPPVIADRPDSEQPDVEVDTTLPDLAGKQVWIIDANALIFQVFHAIPEMTSPQGEAVNALYGFTRDILFLLETKQPDYLLVAFDMSGPTFRHELYEDYKVHRTEMPDALASQLEPIRQMLSVFAVPILEVPGYEADDILATVARMTEEAGGDCLLVTSDKDCRQLISDRVKMFNVRKNQLYDAASLLSDWNVRPEQVVDFQSLVGDAIDNVPGVPLIGPKIASELLARYGSLDAVLDHAHEVAGAKRKQNLIDFREQALVSRELVRLDVNVPIAIDWQAARAGGFRLDDVLELFQRYGFHSFADKVRALTDYAPLPDWQAEYRLINTEPAFREFLTQFVQQRRISIDTETTSISPREAEIVGISIAWRPGEAYYLALRGPAGELCLDAANCLQALRPVLEDPDVEKIGQNLKYDLVVFRGAGVDVQGLAFDSMVASYLLDAGERNHNLDELAKRYLNHTTTKISALIGTGKNQRRMDEVPLADIAHYAAEDADVPLRLEPILRERMREAELESLFADLEIPLIEVLAELEFNGIRVDRQRLAELSVTYGERLIELEREIYQLAGHEFNIASPKQLQQVLFIEQGLPISKKTKTGPSTDASVLEDLARVHALPAKIIEYRQYAKLKNTYVDALPELVNPSTGRVHASFNQVVAATGRLSSSDPNLQNIPIRSQTGRDIRSAFLPGPDGWLLLAADYSQIELRVLAHFSEDATLCEAFERDEDIHALVASQVYNVPLEQVTSDMRRHAKAVNFGVVYGQSAFGLARQIDVDQTEAAAFIDAYFERYPGVDEFLVKILEACRAKGYVSTIMGRRRAISGVRPLVGRQRNLPERTAINTVIQGSAADLIKQAMINVHRRLHKDGLAANMLLQIHDELVFEVSPADHDRLAELVRTEMSQVARLRVPLKVDLKSGRNWSEVEAWA